MSRPPNDRALRDLYRDGDRSDDPQMAALEDLSDPMGEPDDDADDMPQNRPMMEDETMLPGGRMVPIDDLQERGEMTPDLWRKTWPSVFEAHDQGRGPFQDAKSKRARPGDRDYIDREMVRNTPEERIGDEGFAETLLRNLRGGAQYDPFQARLNGHQGPALDAYGEFAGDTRSIQTLPAERERQRLYDAARDEARLKGVDLPSSMMLNGNPGQYVGVVDNRGMDPDPDAIDEDMAEMRANRERAGARY